ncbi:MAG: ferrochelatase [Methanobacteriota archaeon]|nr:MAG: ferrochelatase [Euryarchaeota archaeon]
MGIEETGKTVIILLNMGGPSNLDEVQPFLFNLFSDKDLIDLPLFMKPFQKPLAKLIALFRSKGTKEMYRQIGGGSPILSLTKNFAANVEMGLRERGVNAEVKVVMRYTHPRAKEIVKTLQRGDSVVLFPQYPHFANSTTGSSIKDFLQSYFERFPKGKDPIVIGDWGTEPFYINWWISGIREEVSRLHEIGVKNDIHVIFSSHGLPMRYFKKGETYKDSIDKSRLKIIEGLKDLDVTFHQAYQSRAGPFPWLQPYTDELIEELAGSKAVVMVPLGFVTDHVETSYEIDILYGNLAKQQNIDHFRRIPVPNDNPSYSEEAANFLAHLIQGGDT